MTIGYTPGELVFAMEKSLGLYYWNGDNWVNEPSAVVDPVQNKITATPDHLAYWAVLGEPYKFIYTPLVSR